MKKINKRIFIIATVCFGLLLIPCLIAAGAEDEGTLGTNLIWVVFAKLFYVLRFPTHTLFWTLIINNGEAFFFGGLIINCFFYGLLSERIISLLKHNKV